MTGETLVRVALGGIAIALIAVGVVSAADLETASWLFIHTTYYCLLAAVLCWVGTYLHQAQGVSRSGAAAWLKENWPGVVVALGIATVAHAAVEPALRMLSDEANLVGASKNLFASKTATFTVSGKYYYGSYWDIDVAIDRRPTLYPFLVSLVHAVRGYTYTNAFVVNLAVLFGLILVSYRLAKQLGGETFGVVAALVVAAHPVTLISARSASFDLLAVFFAVLVLKSVLDFLCDGTPGKLAVLWVNACLFAEVRYESVLFLPVVAGLLVLFRRVTWSTLRPYAFVYALTPAFLLPRVWQGLLKGNVPEQEPGAVTFGLDNFLANTAEYFAPILSPSRSYPFHSAVLIALGAAGALLGVRWLAGRVRARDWTLESRFGVFVAAWMVLQVVVVFAYVWGRAQYPSAARLVIAIDTFFSFAAAWLLTRGLERFRSFVPILLGAGLLLTQLPIASQQRMLNRLTQTRESAATWRFFERLGEKRILIVTDRPNHFTIMEYGAMNFESARRDPYLFTALERRLFHDVYVIQQIRISTGQPLPGYELWPDRTMESVFEFQNDADVLVRVSRVAR